VGYSLPAFLGVAAIAAVGRSRARSSPRSKEQTRTLLGGDVGIHLVSDRRTKPSWSGSRAKDALEHGRAQRHGRGEPGDRALVEVWPSMRLSVAGRIELEPQSDFQTLLAFTDGHWGVAIEPALQARLGIGIGDALRIARPLSSSGDHPPPA